MIVAIILAGGFGSRLYPLSTKTKPKQFLKILNKYSTFQSAVLNAAMITNKIVISCNLSLEIIAREQLAEINIDNFSFIFEEETLNTARAIIISALYANDFNQDASILIFPADHIIEDFYALKEKIAQLIKIKDKLVLFGIKPLWKETSYGYILTAKYQDHELQKIEKFIEKPDNNEINQLLLNNHSVYWNSGIFFFPVSFFLQEIIKCNKDFFVKTKKYYDYAKIIDDNLYIATKNYNDKSSNLSIDYLFLEKSSSLFVLKLDIIWCDIGSWDRLLDFFYKNYINQELDKTEHIRKSWGNYVVVARGPGFLVKIINLFPGEKTSLQYHNHRSEHHMIIKGRAKIIIEDRIKYLHQNQLFHIKMKAQHQIINDDERYPLQIIEMQVGDLISEDDIVRLE